MASKQAVLLAFTVAAVLAGLILSCVTLHGATLAKR